MTFPKIELHVHLEGTVRPELLFRIARRNGARLPVDTVDELRALYRFRDFPHFIAVYHMTTNVLRREDDFREVVLAYAQEAASHGAVYLEAIFGPSDAVRQGAGWDEVYSGYCDGAQQAYEETGVRVLLTPDIAREYTLEEAESTVRHAIAYRDRGVVGIGLGGLEAEHPPEQFARVFERARAEGLASVPHAGEVAGVASIRGALEALGAHRIRHGIRAADDPGFARELAGRQTVLDVCPLSNVRTGAVASLEEHPLPRLLDAGVACSLATDDPAMFDTDLSTEHEAAARLGLDPRSAFRAGRQGALCDDATRSRLEDIELAFDWETVAAG